jgi:hypothetical protein
LTQALLDAIAGFVAQADCDKRLRLDEVMRCRTGSFYSG